jgi:tetratricopeptide (TPR) repeat protein
MTLDDTEIWSLSRLGYLLYSRGRLDEAASIFRGLLHLQPRLAYGWYALGLIRRDQGDPRNAAESLQRAINSDPTLWAARLALAELLFQNGRRADAQTILKPLLDASPATDQPSTDPAVRRGQTLWKCWQ